MSGVIAPAEREDESCPQPPWRLHPRATQGRPHKRQYVKEPEEFGKSSASRRGRLRTGGRFDWSDHSHGGWHAAKL